MQALVRSIRNAKAEYRVEPGKKIPAFVQVSCGGSNHVAANDRLGQIYPGHSYLAGCRCPLEI